jgi:hypothetical protein
LTGVVSERFLGMTSIKRECWNRTACSEKLGSILKKNSNYRETLLTAMVFLILP